MTFKKKYFNWMCWQNKSFTSVNMTIQTVDDNIVEMTSICKYCIIFIGWYNS